MLICLTESVSVSELVRLSQPESVQLLLSDNSGCSLNCKHTFIYFSVDVMSTLFFFTPFNGTVMYIVVFVSSHS